MRNRQDWRLCARPEPHRSEPSGLRRTASRSLQTPLPACVVAACCQDKRSSPRVTSKSEADQRTCGRRSRTCVRPEPSADSRHSRLRYSRRTCRVSVAPALLPEPAIHSSRCGTPCIALRHRLPGNTPLGHFAVALLAECTSDSRGSRHNRHGCCEDAVEFLFFCGRQKENEDEIPIRQHLFTDTPAVSEWAKVTGVLLNHRQFIPTDQALNLK